MRRSLPFKLAQAIPVILLVSVLAFLLMSLIPGDPAVVIAGDQASPEAVQAVRERLGLNRPFVERLWLWMSQLARGDFGSSLMLNQSVSSALLELLPVTLSLTLLSIVITLPIGIFVGVIAACYRGRWIDTAMMSVALIGVSVPAFWMAVLATLVFSVGLGWLPTGGYTPLSSGLWGWFRSLIMPASILALFQIGFLARMTRSAMLDVLSQDYVRTARAKGLPEPMLVLQHAFPNALLPVITAIGILVSATLGGSVVIEQVFGLPGVGRLVVQAILSRDYPLVQGVMLIYGFAFVLINLMVDLTYRLADPRVRND